MVAAATAMQVAAAVAVVAAVVDPAPLAAADSTRRVDFRDECLCKSFYART